MNVLLIIAILINPLPKEDKKVINKTYDIENPSGTVVVIDNIFGDVSVESSNDSKAYVTVEIEIIAGTDELIAQAKKDLQLGEKVGNDSVMFFTEAPFIKRCKWGNSWGSDLSDQPNYRFKYHYTVKLPKEVTLDVKTVDHGDVRIKNIAGPISVGNVNGSVEVKNASKIIQASTVNGDVTINFLRTPDQPIDFNTVNGDFNFTLPEDFRAQVYFNTMNGEMFTAFDYKDLGPKVMKSEENGKFKIETKTGVEIGDGGPVLSFRSINGNVYLRKTE